jgi:hypothetical protein
MLKTYQPIQWARFDVDRKACCSCEDRQKSRGFFCCVDCYGTDHERLEDETLRGVVGKLVSLIK